jgi:hypothetical protein
MSGREVLGTLLAFVATKMRWDWLAKKAATLVGERKK